MVNASPNPTTNNINTNIDRECVTQCNNEQHRYKHRSPPVGATHSHRKMNELGIDIDGECVAQSDNGDDRPIIGGRGIVPVNYRNKQHRSVTMPSPYAPQFLIFNF